MASAKPTPRRISQHGQRDVHVQPCGLQRRHQRMHVGAQQLHQHHSNNRHRHGDRTDYFYLILLFRD